MQKTAVLLDTDIGSDIDDAVALAYLLRQPQCELLGVTTVTGDVQRRAALVEAVCHACGRSDVPIRCGRREPLAGGPGQPNVPQFESIAAEHPQLNRPENTAVLFLRDTIRSRPHEVTLLTIGPLSNIALLFALDPEIPYLVKGLVSMVGAFSDSAQAGAGRTEWNAKCDPTATRMVYEAARVTHHSVGLDVTEQCKMAAAEVARRFVSEPLRTVRLMAQSWFQHADSITFHDPLAAACVFHPELVGWRTGRVAADSANPGQTVFTPGPGPDQVATTVSAAAFFDDYFSVF